MNIPTYYIGVTFNRLTVKEYVGKNERNEMIYKCECKCGNTKEVSLPQLKSNIVRSCGCLRNETLKKAAQSQLVEGTNIASLKRGIQSNNSTGVKGVYFDKSRNKFKAYIGYKGKQIKLGSFDSLEEATKIRKAAEQIYHKPLLEKYETRFKRNT